jgi:pimeloyl-ACP methyl ester carboxylesterase
MSIQRQQFSDEIGLLQQLDLPLLIIFGKDEKVVDPDYLDDAPLKLWQNMIYKIAGASHLVNIDRPEEFNTLVASYAVDMFKLSRIT